MNINKFQAHTYINGKIYVFNVPDLVSDLD